MPVLGWLVKCVFLIGGLIRCFSKGCLRWKTCWMLEAVERLCLNCTMRIMKVAVGHKTVTGCVLAFQMPRKPLRMKIFRPWSTAILWDFSDGGHGEQQAATEKALRSRWISLARWWSTRMAALLVSGLHRLNVHFDTGSSHWRHQQLARNDGDGTTEHPTRFGQAEQAKACKAERSCWGSQWLANLASKASRFKTWCQR